MKIDYPLAIALILACIVGPGAIIALHFTQPVTKHNPELVHTTPQPTPKQPQHREPTHLIEGTHTCQHIVVQYVPRKTVTVPVYTGETCLHISFAHEPPTAD